MGKINWGRVVLCGLVTGGVCMALTAPVFLLALRESEYVQALHTARAAAQPRVEPLLMATPLNFAAGIWIMWLYAAIRPRYGPGPKTAALAGIAGWFAVALIEFELALLLLLPISLGGLAAPLGVALPAMVLAAVVGAWHYKE
ncbi:MAG TPA: hypothetical protein VEH49_09190 [Methylomirabilota bacterium]|jgi:hypothetical protein|nr:hypothetical protein [Methylomirabilota bacterium]